MIYYLSIEFDGFIKLWIPRGPNSASLSVHVIEKNSKSVDPGLDPMPQCLCKSGFFKLLDIRSICI